MFTIPQTTTEERMRELKKERTKKQEINLKKRTK